MKKKNKYADLRVINTRSVNLWEDGYDLTIGGYHVNHHPMDIMHSTLAEDPSGNRYAVMLDRYGQSIISARPVRLGRDVLDSLAHDLLLEGYELDSWDVDCTDWIDRDQDAYGHLQPFEIQYVNRKMYAALNWESINDQLEDMGYTYSPTESDSPIRLIYRWIHDPLKVKVFEDWQEADMYITSNSESDEL